MLFDLVTDLLKSSHHSTEIFSNRKGIVTFLSTTHSPGVKDRESFQMFVLGEGGPQEGHFCQP